MPADAALETLILRYLDRSLSPAEMLVLEDRLITDPVARERFVLISLMRIQLPRALRPARQRRRSLQLIVGVAAALVLAVLGMLAVQRPSPRGIAPPNTPLAQSAPHITVAGMVTGDGPHGVKPIDGDTILTPGDELAFADGATAIITWPGEATEARHTGVGRLRWLGDTQGKRLELTQGNLELKVAHQPADRPFLIRTRNTVITVVGTRLQIEAGPTASAVSVIDGVVAAERITDHAQVRIESGHCCAVVDDGALTVEPITPDGDVVASMSHDDGRWFALAGGGALSSISAVPGLFAAPAAALTVALSPPASGAGRGEWPWAAFSMVFAVPKDWSRARSLAFWFQGTGDGQALRIELEGAHPPGGDAGSNPRYITTFNDTSASWRRVELPLASFVPRQDVPIPADPRWDRHQVNAVLLVVTPARPGRWAWADLEVRR